jgi:hypothetical protein
MSNIAAPKQEMSDVMPGINPNLAKTIIEKIPSNDDLLQQLSNFRKIIHEQREGNKDLDEKGRQMALALEQFAWNTEHLIKEKNWDQAAQKFAERAVKFGERVSKEAQLRQGDTKETLTRLANITSNLKRLFASIFTSDTRELLLDATGLVGSVLTLTAQQEDQYKQGKLPDLSDDMKREISGRYRNILAKVGRKSEFKEVREDILNMFDYWREIRNKSTATATDKSSTSSSGQHTSILKDNAHIMTKEELDEQRLLNDLRFDFRFLYEEAISIVQRFVQKYDLRKLEDNFWSLYNEINNDQDASSFFYDLRQWSNSIVENPDSSENEQVIEEGKTLINRAFNIRKKFGRKISNQIEEFKEVLDSLQADRYLSAYKEELQHFKDASSSGTFIDTVSQFRHLALPIIKEMMQDIKLQPIDIKESFGHITIDNLVLKIQEVSIDDIFVQLKFGMKDLMMAEVKIKNIQAKFQDVKFTYERTATPQISDSGVLNCFVASRDWKMKMVVREERGRTPFFEMSEAKAGIRRFKIDIVESQHKVLNSLMLPFINAKLRKRAQDAIEGVLKEHGEFITHKMNELFSTSPFSSQNFSPLSFINLSVDNPQPKESSVSSQ